MSSPAVIVQKYGGATLADPQKIKAVADRIAQAAREGKRLIVVVSAMGKTTNSLIELAGQVSNRPHLRELDMLLTVGERISMALLSMALNDRACAAISFTGSQAGIFTDTSHVNAFIKDVKPIRVEEALQQNKVVILAGFQGVSPVTKEITTLGRGGSDTSAVAMAAHFKAERCEILKDVPAVFTADPRAVSHARPLEKLNYDQLMEMTFWGAKVLHYRSVELAMKREVPLYIGPASGRLEEGTLVQKGWNMFETSRALSLNSHETVLQLNSKSGSALESLQALQKRLEEKQIAFPQILSAKSQQIYLTGPQEIMEAIKKEIASLKEFTLAKNDFSTVTLTCTGVTSPEITQQILKKLADEKIQVEEVMLSSMSVTVLLNRESRDQALQKLHQLI